MIDKVESVPVSHNLHSFIISYTLFNQASGSLGILVSKIYCQYANYRDAAEAIYGSSTTVIQIPDIPKHFISDLLIIG